jgi:hypothetical protein
MHWHQFLCSREGSRHHYPTGATRAGQEDHRWSPVVSLGWPSGNLAGSWCLARFSFDCEPGSLAVLIKSVKACHWWNCLCRCCICSDCSSDCCSCLGCTSYLIFSHLLCPLHTAIMLVLADFCPIALPWPWQWWWWCPLNLAAQLVLLLWWCWWH